MTGKPRIRITKDRWHFDFGDGLIGEVWIDHADRSAWPSRCHRWALAGQPMGHSYSLDHAARALWCLAAQLRPPAPLEDAREQALELAYRAEGVAPSRAAAMIRELLLRRTGLAWSVRAGRGPSRGAVLISGLPPKPKVEGQPRLRAELVDGMVSAPDAALLAAVLRVEFVGPAGFTVSKRIGARSRAVLAIAGLGAAELEQLDYRTLRLAVRADSHPLH